MIPVSVCIGTSCHLKGSYNVIHAFSQRIEQYGLHEKLDFKTAFCSRECPHEGVSVLVGDTPHRVDATHAAEFLDEVILPLAQANIQ